MQTLTKRGIQGVIKTTANELSKGIEPWRGGAWEGQGMVRLEYLNPENGLVVSTNPKSITIHESPPSGSSPVRTMTLNNDDVTQVTGHWKASYQYHPGEGIKAFKELSSR